MKKRTNKYIILCVVTSRASLLWQGISHLQLHPLYSSSQFELCLFTPLFCDPLFFSSFIITTSFISCRLTQVYTQESSLSHCLLIHDLGDDYALYVLMMPSFSSFDIISHHFVSNSFTSSCLTNCLSLPCLVFCLTHSCIIYDSTVSLVRT